MTTTIRIIEHRGSAPDGKLADAELHFDGGDLDGLKLVGFSIWKSRRGGLKVSFPARSYAAAGTRRSFSLLRPIAGATGQARVQDLILQAFASLERDEAAEPAPRSR